MLSDAMKASAIKKMEGIKPKSGMEDEAYLTNMFVEVVEEQLR